VIFNWSMRQLASASVGAVAFVALATIGASPAPRAADEKAVADLDTQYQAAVERNDAETMDRILLDDFVLTCARRSAGPPRSARPH